PHAAEVPGLHRRRGEPSDVCRRCVPVHEGGGGGVAAREGVQHRQDRRGPRDDRGGGLERADDRQPRQISRHHGEARRSAEDFRRAGAGPDRGREGDLLRDGRDPLAGNRKSGDADGARLPARGGGHAGDLHESVPFMYVSTGTGPYNASIDPIMVDEWHRMAWHEVQEMTRRGVPGVWTWGFYDGWAPNYMFWTGMGHNTIGRFYETFGNR